MGFFGHPSEHPDATTVEIAGKDVPFLLTKQAFEVAVEEGVDLSKLDTELDDETVEGAIDSLEQLVILLYIGVIEFREAGHETPSMEDINRVVTPTNADRIANEVMKRYRGLTDEEIEAVMGKG